MYRSTVSESQMPRLFSLSSSKFCILIRTGMMSCFSRLSSNADVSAIILTVHVYQKIWFRHLSNDVYNLVAVTVYFYFSSSKIAMVRMVFMSSTNLESRHTISSTMFAILLDSISFTTLSVTFSPLTMKLPSVYYWIHPSLNFTYSCSPTSRH